MDRKLGGIVLLSLLVGGLAGILLMQPSGPTIDLTTQTANAAASNHSPQVNYMLSCQGCHSPTGAALGDQVPAFEGQVAKFLSVQGGREYLIRVPGVTKSDLGDEELAELMNWLIANFDVDHIPDDFAPYTAREISLARTESLTNVTSIREELVSMQNPEHY